MEKYAFTMQLRPGHEAEYKKRHDSIWPELITVFKQAGILDYSIHFDQQTGTLFALLTRDKIHRVDELSQDPIVQKWWSYLADIIETEDNNTPVIRQLEQMFSMH